MRATAYKISDKPREASFSVASIQYFDLGDPEEIAAHEILENPLISLYCLDFENQQAVFVETPSEIDLSGEPFYFVTQLEAATRVITLPFESMLKLAKPSTFTNTRFVFIHSVGRSGSTLASQVFSQVPNVFNLSEPDALTNLVIAKNTNLINEEKLLSLLQASVYFLCHRNTSRICVIKGRSFVLELGAYLKQLFPSAKHLFLYRDAETYLNSGLRAFGQMDGLSEEERAERHRQRRLSLGKLVPEIAAFDPDRFLPHAGTLTLMWLSAMQRYVDLYNLDIDTLAIQYNSWLSHPQETAKAMLDFCNCSPNDMQSIHQVLNRDSQEGTRLARTALEKDKVISAEDLEELQWHLSHHVLIKTAQFEVPNTFSN